MREALEGVMRLCVSGGQSREGGRGVCIWGTPGSHSGCAGRGWDFKVTEVTAGTPLGWLS